MLAVLPNEIKLGVRFSGSAAKFLLVRKTMAFTAIFGYAAVTVLGVVALLTFAVFVILKMNKSS
jgi:high-affinity K+ transport system ATPase subunit B